MQRVLLYRAAWQLRGTLTQELRLVQFQPLNQHLSEDDLRIVIF